MLPKNFKKSVLWKDLMEKTSKFPELNGDMEYLLEDLVKGYKPTKHYPTVDFDKPLIDSFWWLGSPQGEDFWVEISYKRLPKEYT